MIFNARRKEFLQQVSKVAKAATNAHINKTLSGIHIETFSRENIVRLTATNLEVSIKVVMPVTVETDGCAVIPANLLLGMLERFPEDDVYVETSGEKITISSGNASYQVISLPVNAYPKVEIPVPGETVTVSGLKTLIRKSAFATGQLDGRSTTHCVNLKLQADGLSAVACNGFCMVQTQGDKNCTGQASLLVPASSLKLFASIASDSDVYEMGITGTNGKSVVFYDGALLFSARLVEGRYFDSDKMFDSFKGEITATVKADYLRNLFCGISTLDARGSTGISFTDTGINILCQGKDSEGKAIAVAKVTGQSKQQRYFNSDNFGDCLRVFSDMITLSQSPEGHLLISDEKTRCLLSAMRAPAKITTTADEKKSGVKKPREKKAA